MTSHHLHKPKRKIGGAAPNISYAQWVNPWAPQPTTVRYLPGQTYADPTLHNAYASSHTAAYTPRIIRRVAKKEPDPPPEPEPEQESLLEEEPASLEEQKPIETPAPASAPAAVEIKEEASAAPETQPKTEAPPDTKTEASATSQVAEEESKPIKTAQPSAAEGTPTAATKVQAEAAQEAAPEAAVAEASQPAPDATKPAEGPTEAASAVQPKGRPAAQDEKNVAQPSEAATPAITQAKAATVEDAEAATDVTVHSPPAAASSSEGQVGVHTPAATDEVPEQNHASESVVAEAAEETAGKTQDMSDEAHVEPEVVDAPATHQESIDAPQASEPEEVAVDDEEVPPPAPDPPKLFGEIIETEATEEPLVERLEVEHGDQVQDDNHELNEDDLMAFSSPPPAPSPPAMHADLSPAEQGAAIMGKNVAFTPDTKYKRSKTKSRSKKFASSSSQSKGSTSSKSSKKSKSKSIATPLPPPPAKSALRKTSQFEGEAVELQPMEEELHGDDDDDAEERIHQHVTETPDHEGENQNKVEVAGQEVPEIKESDNDKVDEVGAILEEAESENAMLITAGDSASGKEHVEPEQATSVHDDIEQQNDVPNEPVHDAGGPNEHDTPEDTKAGSNDGSLSAREENHEPTDTAPDPERDLQDPASEDADEIITDELLDETISDGSVSSEALTEAQDMLAAEAEEHNAVGTDPEIAGSSHHEAAKHGASDSADIKSIHLSGEAEASVESKLEHDGIVVADQDHPDHQILIEQEEQQSSNSEEESDMLEEEESDEELTAHDLHEVKHLHGTTDNMPHKVTEASSTDGCHEVETAASVEEATSETASPTTTEQSEGSPLHEDSSATAPSLDEADLDNGSPEGDVKAVHVEKTDQHSAVEDVSANAGISSYQVTPEAHVLEATVQSDVGDTADSAMDVEEDVTDTSEHAAVDKSPKASEEAPSGEDVEQTDDHEASADDSEETTVHDDKSKEHAGHTHTAVEVAVAGAIGAAAIVESTEKSSRAEKVAATSEAPATTVIEEHEESGQASGEVVAHENTNVTPEIASEAHTDPIDDAAADGADQSPDAPHSEVHENAECKEEASASGTVREEASEETEHREKSSTEKLQGTDEPNAAAAAAAAAATESIDEHVEKESKEPAHEAEAVAVKESSETAGASASLPKSTTAHSSSKKSRAIPRVYHSTDHSPPRSRRSISPSHPTSPHRVRHVIGFERPHVSHASKHDQPSSPTRSRHRSSHATSSSSSKIPNASEKAYQDARRRREQAILDMEEEQRRIRRSNRRTEKIEVELQKAAEAEEQHKENLRRRREIQKEIDHLQDERDAIERASRKKLLDARSRTSEDGEKGARKGSGGGIGAFLSLGLKGKESQSERVQDRERKNSHKSHDERDHRPRSSRGHDSHHDAKRKDSHSSGNDRHHSSRSGGSVKAEKTEKEHLQERPRTSRSSRDSGENREVKTLKSSRDHREGGSRSHRSKTEGHERRSEKDEDEDKSSSHRHNRHEQRGERASRRSEDKRGKIATTGKGKDNGLLGTFRKVLASPATF